jgi:hypothetical protein
MPSKTTRPSPTESATEFEPGTERLGNDGNQYVVKRDKNGRHRWALVKEPVQQDALVAEPEPVKQDAREPVAEPEPAKKKKSTRRPKTPEQAPEPVAEPEPVKETTEPAKKKKSTRRPKTPEQAPEPEKQEIVPEPTAPVKEKRKYVRNAPTSHAKEHQDGHQEEGQDGTMYIVKADKNNVKRWFRVPATKN